MNNGMFNEYISKKYKGNAISEHELAALRDGDIASIVDAFLNMKNEHYNKQLVSALKSMAFYMGDDLVFEEFSQKREMQFANLVWQLMDGDQNVFVGLCGEEESMLKVASLFAREDFKCLDAYSYDSICELINCINGAFATKLSDEDIQVALYPPVFYESKHIKSESGFYVTTLSIAGKKLDMITAIDENITL